MSPLDQFLNPSVLEAGCAKRGEEDLEAEG